MQRPGKLVLAAGLAALAAGVLSPATGSAQWIRLQRCGSALPCAVPFAVRYAPDPLIAGQYGRISPNGVSGRIAFEPWPVVHIDQPQLSLQLTDFAEQAARRFVIANPPPPPSRPAEPAPPRD